MRSLATIFTILSLTGCVPFWHETEVAINRSDLTVERINMLSERSFTRDEILQDFGNPTYSTPDDLIFYYQLKAKWVEFWGTPSIPKTKLYDLLMLQFDKESNLLRYEVKNNIQFPQVALSKWAKVGSTLPFQE